MNNINLKLIIRENDIKYYYILQNSLLDYLAQFILLVNMLQ